MKQGAAHYLDAQAITPDFVPQNEADLLAALESWEWRIYSGQLYKIMVKSDDGDGQGFVMPFKPNSAQRQFLAGLHYRNVILKARQLGFTTLIAVVWLDHALFNADQRCGIIAHELDAAESIFADKVVFAYDNLPEGVRVSIPLLKKTAKQLTFANNSSIRVATSMRSGTIHRLHVSELGKIAAKYPGKAKEIVTGSLPAVPGDGVAIIESTAEGQSGEFYDIATKAEARAFNPADPTPREWKFHFFPWWRDPGYTMDPTGITITPEDHKYFAEVEAKAGCKISLGQRAWYISFRENDFSGDSEKMWQEMPSTSEECWRKSTEGTFYARQLAKARAQGRICTIPHVEHAKVCTFWDIGAGDGTGIWLMQHVGTQSRFIRYIEGWAEGYSHFVKTLRETGYLFGPMFLPHDANHQRQTADKVASPLSILQELAPDWSWHIVPRVETIQHGIDLTRAKFSEAWFDAEGCKAGLDHLAMYRKKWNARLSVWGNEPEKLEGHSEAADAFRQWAQGFDPAYLNQQKRPRRRAIGGMSV